MLPCRWGECKGKRGAVSKALSLVYFVIGPATILSSVMQDVSSQAQVKLSMPGPVFHFCKTVSRAILHLTVQRSSNLIQHPWAKHYRSWVGTSHGGCRPGSLLHPPSCNEPCLPISRPAPTAVPGEVFPGGRPCCVEH